MFGQRYQPLPISTGAVGVDRCGNIELYTAPGVIHARACWPCNQYPPGPYRWPWPGWGMPAGAAPGWGHGCTCCGSGSALATLLGGGAALANWMINAPKPTPSALPVVKVA